MGSGVVGGQVSGVQGSMQQGYLGEVRAGEGAGQGTGTRLRGPRWPKQGFPHLSLGHLGAVGGGRGQAGDVQVGGDGG